MSIVTRAGEEGMSSVLAVNHWQLFDLRKLEDIVFCQQQRQLQQQQQQARQWTPSASRSGVRRTTSCALCRTNGERRNVYESHSLKDERGFITCPVLYRYVCPFCGATGRLAHTVRHCPVAPAGASVVKSLNTPRHSVGRRAR